MKMWSGRFRQPLNSEFERWQRSFPFDRRLLGEELAASAAHARALAAAGVLTSAELERTLGGLKQIGETWAKALPEHEAAEDIHHFVELKLAEFIGETAYKLHTGRSRNEQIATDLRLFVRNSIDELTAALGRFLTTLLARAEEAGTAAMPAYTHTQRAEPVLVAHWLLAYNEMFLRDAGRLADCRKRVNVCPLGAAAVAGTFLPLDREAIAAALGFSAPAANSLDATSDRDFALEFVQTLCILAVHLSRWAEEMVLFSTQEYGFILLPEPYATGSSAMPQKKNPDALELIRGKAGRVAGAAAALLMTMKGLPLAYNKDMQETQEPVFDAAETAIMMIKIATGFSGEFQFNYPVMQAAAQNGFMNAMAAAAYLVKRGVPFRHAHEQIGNAVQFAIEKGCELQDLALAELKRFSPACEDDFYSYLTLEAVLGCHDVAGGTAPERVKQALAAGKRRVREFFAGLSREALHAGA